VACVRTPWPIVAHYVEHAVAALNRSNRTPWRRSASTRRRPSAATNYVFIEMDRHDQAVILGKGKARVAVFRSFLLSRDGGGAQ
jgi:hypothetical protein